MKNSETKSTLSIDSVPSGKELRSSLYGDGNDEASLDDDFPDSSSSVPRNVDPKSRIRIEKSENDYTFDLNWRGKWERIKYSLENSYIPFYFWWIFFTIFLVIIPVFGLGISLINLNNCPVQPLLPVLNIVSGICSILIFLTLVPKAVSMYEHITFGLVIFHFFWFISGLLITFRMKIPDFEKNCCDYTLYWFTYFNTIFSLIFWVFNIGSPVFILCSSLFCE